MPASRARSAPARPPPAADRRGWPAGGSCRARSQPRPGSGGSAAPPGAVAAAAPGHRRVGVPGTRRSLPALAAVTALSGAPVPAITSGAAADDHQSTTYIGPRPLVRPRFRDHQRRPGHRARRRGAGHAAAHARDVAILASDGIATLSDDRIAATCVEPGEEGAGEIAETLIRQVNAAARPRQDNATVIVVRCAADREVDTVVVTRGGRRGSREG